MRQFILLVTMLATALARGQSPIPNPAPDAVLSPTTNGPGAAESTAYSLDDKHKLAAGDKISFQIIEDRDPPKSLTVTDSGELDVPYVGRVVAQAKTCKQLAQKLKALLEKEYYYRASVVIGLDSVTKVRGRLYTA